MAKKIPVVYQVVADKETSWTVPIKDKEGKIVKESKKTAWRTTLLGEYTNRMVADFIAQRTQVKDKGKVTVKGGFPTPDVSKNILNLTENIYKYIVNTQEDWFRKYGEPKEVIECME